MRMTYGTPKTSSGGTLYHLALKEGSLNFVLKAVSITLKMEFWSWTRELSTERALMMEEGFGLLDTKSQKSFEPFQGNGSPFLLR